MSTEQNILKQLKTNIQQSRFSVNQSINKNRFYNLNGNFFKAGIPVIMLLILFIIINSCKSEISESSVSLKENYRNLIPKPVSVIVSDGIYTLKNKVTIYVEPENEEMMKLGIYLAELLNTPTGFNIKVQSKSGKFRRGNIYLTLHKKDTLPGKEGYFLEVEKNYIHLVAKQPEGIFRGIQTLRQLFNPAIEQSTIQQVPWEIATGKITDYPRFEWRSAMLDVSRHFFSVNDVKRFIDLLTAYKINRFHIHLADDQGWRIQINSWPNLTLHGGSTEVGGGKGGYYTQEEYSEIVNYAREHYITVVPEIDMPGHTNAALASYPELNCNNTAPELYTGMRVGFSSLCIHKEITYKFLDDVIGEIANLTPGPYFHIGGDEAHSTDKEDYIYFINRVQEIVRSHNKLMVGWDEISQAQLDSNTILQHWNSSHEKLVINRGLQVIMSPGHKMYLDMKYDSTTKLGLTWAGYINVKDAYTWDPATLIDGLGEKNILGTESPLWSETLNTIKDIEYMTFPRLPGYAEIGWSPPGWRNWDEYKIRLSSHGPRFKAMEINFHQSEMVDWQ
ncbi:MAG: beta-N-acetylhexosaminidase [Bacteroidales bacterium]|nr:beta-N-acetylhexosaminidase [Bacteroidales bacterium]